MVVKQDKPFIKLLRSPNSGYFFDVNRNEIIAVEDDVYDYLEKEQDGIEVLPSQEVAEKISVLKENGYLSGNKVKEIRHGSTDMLDLILSRNMRKITIQITQDCNFRCSYCAYTSNVGGQRKHSKKSISIETAEKAILFLRNHSADCDEVNIGFYGGEPLVDFELLKKLTMFANENFIGKKLTFAITTNGTLLTDEIVEFLEKNNFNVLLSIDGIKKIHDKNRVFAMNNQGTFEAIEKRIQSISKKYPKFFELLSINMVVDPSNNYDDICSIFDHSLFGKLKIQTTLIDDEMIGKPNVFSEDYIVKSTYNEFLSNLCLLNRFSYNALTPLAKESATKRYSSLAKMDKLSTLPFIWAPAGPCVPGELRMMVATNGDFIACERVSEISDCMIIGNVEKGFDKEKIKALLNIGVLTAEECKNCYAFSGCGMCGRHADDNGCLSGEKKLSFCNAHKRNFFYNLLEKMLIEESTQIYSLDREGV